MDITVGISIPTDCAIQKHFHITKKKEQINGIQT